MSELFSEMLPKTAWVAPKTMLIIKNNSRNYKCYWSATKNKWSGLLEATIYTDNEVPNIKDGEIIDYRKEIGLVK